MSEYNTALTFGMEADVYPLNEKIVLRSGMAMFESHVASIPTNSPDCVFLSSIAFSPCFYGASDFPIYPFVCVSKRPYRDLPSAAEVLAELQASNFQSEHIASLDSTHVEYPGYQPWTKNDEIHTNPDEQYMFEHEADDDKDSRPLDESADLSRACHTALRDYVLNQHLFYVLVHDKPKQRGQFVYSELVLLFAVGVSPTTGHLVGAVSNQVCHNLCD